MIKAGIYVHVPFCRTKCAYCDFYSLARPELADGYLQAVEREFEQRRSELADAEIKTLYFGGGTPSQLPLPIFERLARLLLTADVEEFTAEANPDDITPELSQRWRDVGVNRISLGIQSLNDEELRSVGRRHTAQGALKAIAELHSCGFDDISGDLIYGLPGQTVDTFRDSLRRLIDSGITHLSAYCLSYEPGTLLWRRREQGLVSEASEDTIAEMYEILCNEARQAGFEHYEISNFALPGRRARHNSSYWQGVPYLGLGPGAHSLGADLCRRHVEPDLRAYISDPAALLVEDEETADDRTNDLIMISLRRIEGLPLSSLNSCDRTMVMSSARPWIKSGDLLLKDDSLVIPESSWLLSDAIIRDLFV